MKKQMKRKDELFKIKILGSAAIILGLATGFKLVYTNTKKAELENENARLRQEFQNMLDAELDASHTAMKNNEKYNINDSIEIGDKTLYFVSDITPTTTPTPTAEPEYSRYINTSSDEFIASEDGIYHETKSKVVMDFYEVNEMIAFYSKVFQLDDTKVGNKIYEIIEQDEDAWKEENILNGIQYESKEQAIARTIADISNFPQNYGLGDIEVDEYELSHYEPEELIYKFSDVIGVNPYIALAVAYSESGTKLDSYNFETRYNVGGLRRRSGDPHPATSWGLTIYKNEAEGLYRFITILHDNFFVERDSGYDRIKAMSYSYCEDPSHWRNLVGSVYYNLTDNGYAYYYNKFKGYRDLVYPTKEKEYTI